MNAFIRNEFGGARFCMNGHFTTPAANTTRPPEVAHYNPANGFGMVFEIAGSSSQVLFDAQAMEALESH